MKNRLKIAVLIVVINLAIYTVLSQYAVRERGHDMPVFGGEDLLLVFGMLIALLIIIGGCKHYSERQKNNDCPTTTVIYTESIRSSKKEVNLIYYLFIIISDFPQNVKGF